MMAGYLVEVRRMEKFFNGFEVRYVPRLDNHDANHLPWIASSRALTPLDVIVERLSKPSVKPEESTSEEVGADLMVIDEPPQQPAYDWMSPIRAYLDNKPPSDDNAKVKPMARKSRMYHLIDGVLYRQGANGMSQPAARLADLYQTIGPQASRPLLETELYKTEGMSYRGNCNPSISKTRWKTYHL
jgi:hypothetical protein